MHIQTVPVLIDDHGIPCLSGDSILLQAGNMTGIAKAIIKEIYTVSFSVTFDDRLMGDQTRSFRVSDVTSCIRYRRKI